MIDYRLNFTNLFKAMSPSPEPYNCKITDFKVSEEAHRVRGPTPTVADDTGIQGLLRAWTRPSVAEYGEGYY